MMFITVMTLYLPIALSFGFVNLSTLYLTCVYTCCCRCLQENWRGEIEQCLSKLTTDGIPNDSELIHQREEELKHAQDVRALYEQKLNTADKLYRELKSCKMQLDAKELELQRLVL